MGFSAGRSRFTQGIESLAKVKAPEGGMWEMEVGKVVQGLHSQRPQMAVWALDFLLWLFQEASRA